MLANSAYITIGEAKSSFSKHADDDTPHGEYAILRRGHFSRVFAMSETRYSANSAKDTAKFVIRSFGETWNTENIFVSDEITAIEYLALQSVFRRKKRIAIRINDIASLNHRLPLAYARLGQLPDHILCQSQHSKVELAEILKVAPSKIKITGFRVDTDFYQPDTTMKTDQLICSAGTTNRDYATFMAALSPLQIPVKIAADTEWRYTTKGATQKADYEIPPSVEMRSLASHVKLRELYAKSALVVVPLKDPTSRGTAVALEAMAMGKPVILTRNPHVEELIIDGETGFFVPPNDPDAIRQKIKDLLDNPALCEKVGARAREWICENCTIQGYANRIMSIWD